MSEFFAVSLTSPHEQTPFSGQARAVSGASGLMYRLYAGPTPASYWANWQAGASATEALLPLNAYLRPDSPAIFGDSTLAETASLALCSATPDSFFQDRTNAWIWVHFSRHYWLYARATITRAVSLWLAESPISDSREPITIGGQDVYFRIQSLSLPSLSENDQFFSVKGSISLALLNLDGLFSAFPFYGSLIEVYSYRGAQEPDDLGQYTKLKEGVCRSYQKSAESVYVSADLLTQTLRFLISLPRAQDIFPAVYTDPLLAVSMPLQNGENLVPVIAGYRFISQKPVYSSGKVTVDADARPSKQFSSSLVSIGGAQVVCLQQYIAEDAQVAIQRDYFLIPTGAGSGAGGAAAFIGAIASGLWLAADGEQYTGGIHAVEALAFASAQSTPYEFLKYLLTTYSNFPFPADDEPSVWDANDLYDVKNKLYPLSYTLDKNTAFHDIITAFKLFQLMILQKHDGRLTIRSKFFPHSPSRRVALTRPPTESLEAPELYSSLAVTFQSINSANFRTSKTAFLRDASHAAAVSSRYRIVEEKALEIPVPIDQFPAALNALERIYQHPRRRFSCECLADYDSCNFGDILLYDLVQVNLDDPVAAGFGGTQTFICTGIDYRAKTITLEEIL
jgi:hypothetical protein